ncbi:hypothetical protein P0136_10340 [Lentisphaerota bacterium ZTH]|nr:hypothetical protein JYG24_12150 [Lentisphaerota bacterium]WET05759.1 hypothetical protein P0136_10340 [Lentisphaerota bacterium ZTH]
MRPLKLGSAGMRGVVGSGLTPENTINFARAFGTFIDGGRVIVARDTRFSSEMLHRGVISGLLSCGCEVYDAGIVPAPLVHFMTEKLEAVGALLIGGGHQSAGWNSIIPLNRNGAYCNSIQLRELFDIYHSRRFLASDWSGVKKPVPVNRGILDSYLDALCALIDVESIAAAGLRVVCDFCNGSGSVMAEKLALRLGVEIIPINNVLSGVLPHDPEPRPRSSFQVQALMEPLKADAGFVFNSDMSRVCLVSDSGETLSEEYSFPLGAGYMLHKSSQQNPRVVTNICSSRSLDEVVKAQGGTVIKTRVGQSNVIDHMKESGAVLGGEGCGAFACSSWLDGFDAFFMTAVVLEAMAARKMRLSELVDELPRYHIVKKTINCSSAHAFTIIRSLREHFKDADVSEEDGLRFDWPDGWISIRTSTTDQVIRLISEWKNKNMAEDKAMHIRGIIERLTAS